MGCGVDCFRGIRGIKGATQCPCGLRLIPHALRWGDMGISAGNDSRNSLAVVIA